LTSAYQGRCTINPLPHIDPIGTILVPLAGSLTGIPLIGWAKPVPVNEMNFRRKGPYGVVVALAGPFSNILLALLSVAALQLLTLLQLQFDLPEEVMRVIRKFLTLMVLINLSLCFFNLIPLPPLDGSHVLWHFLVKHRPALWPYFDFVMRYSMLILLVLLWTGVLRAYSMHVTSPLFQSLMDFAYYPLDLFLTDANR
jgi:Zn-dependent protease